MSSAILVSQGCYMMLLCIYYMPLWLTLITYHLVASVVRFARPFASVLVPGHEPIDRQPAPLEGPSRSWVRFLATSTRTAVAKTEKKRRRRSVKLAFWGQPRSIPSQPRSIQSTEVHPKSSKVHPQSTWSSQQ